jgi:uncharacterized membrane protein
MTALWLLVSIVLGVLLHDTRRRLTRLEQAERERDRAARSWMDEERGARPVAAAEPFVEPELYLPPEDEFVTISASRGGEPHLSAPVKTPAPAPAPDVRPIPRQEPQPEPALSPEPQPEAQPQPQPEPEYEPVATPPSSGFGFEDLFGRKLPIWAGGITLIVAAVLMVKYSIDSGLLSPVVRVVLGMLFSAVLIGLGEAARRREDFVRDARVAQALAGAGVGGLYAATLAAANLYGLVGPGLAFAGLSAITALALGLALRFGAPCAVLGLLGGLATPAMVQSTNPSVPLLAGYLAVVIGAITLLSRRQRWAWLGIGALTGGGGWSLAVIAMGGLDGAATLSIGLLVLLFALALPILGVPGRTAPLLRVASAVVGALQLALLVATGHFAPLTWGLYGLLSLAFVVLAGRAPMLRRTVPVPLLTALGLAAVWPDPDAGLFAAVMAGIALIYGGYALRHLWRGEGGYMDVGLLAAIALGGYTIAFAKFYTITPDQDSNFALFALAFAALPALGGALGWRTEARHDDARFALLAGCTGVLVVLSGLVGLPEWNAPVVIAAVAAGLLALAGAARDDRLAKGALGFLAAAVLALVVSVETTAELARLGDTAPAVPHLGRALLRWGVVTLATLAFAWRLAPTALRFVLQPLAVLLGYGLVAQMVPAMWLAAATAAALMLMVEADKRRAALRLDPAMGTAAALLALWAVEPVAQWLLAGLCSLAAMPVLAIDLPNPATATLRLVVPVLAVAFTLWRQRARLPDTVRIGAATVVGGLALVGVHVLYKQLFLIGTDAAFVRHGLAERCLWEAALVGAGLAAWRWLGERGTAAALALVAAGVAHGVLYTLVLHDPLWARQAVGPWPLANLLLPAFGIVFAGPSLAARIAPATAGPIQRPGDLLRMATVFLFAFATLRQVFAGSVLVGIDVGAGENIGRSVLAIALALGFLGWGIHKGLRDWRIASLVLMLGAVGKVFVFDASGLEGLLRIVSFLALGFSLIGIGWLYSRYLKPDAKA